MVPEQPGTGEAPLAQAISNIPDLASPEVTLRSITLSSDSWEKKPAPTVGMGGAGEQN